MAKPSWAGNAGGAVRGMARALMAGKGKKVGLYARTSGEGQQTGVPVGSEAPKGKAKGKR